MLALPAVSVQPVILMMQEFEVHPETDCTHPVFAPLMVMALLTVASTGALRFESEKVSV